MDKERVGRANGRAAHQRRLHALAAHYSRQAESSVPKHVRLRNAVLAAIRDGSLKAGDQIPPEQGLCSAVNVSLGTVQRALASLSNDGTLVRQHGRGTFVAEPRRPVDEPWQMRFLAEDRKGLLPVYSRIVDQCVVSTTGPWRDALGPDPKGYLRISRLLNIGDKFKCYSWFFVQMGRFPGLRRRGAQLRESINLRRLLAEELGAPTMAVIQHLKIVQFGPDVCEALGIAPGTTGLMFDAIGQGYGRDSIFFHRIWVPPNDCTLDITHAGPPRESSARDEQHRACIWR